MKLVRTPVTAEAFDPVSQTWNPTNSIPNPPIDGLCFPNMVSLGNSKVLLAGGGCSNRLYPPGNTTNAASLYDPATNQWTATGPGIPGMNVPYFMTYGRDQFGMVRLTGGNALAFAGCSGACTEADNQGYGFGVVGNSTEIYSFQSNTWTVVTPLTTPRGNFETSNLNQGAVVLQDGRVLACNGSTDGVSQDTNTCEVYDPLANTWTLTESIGGSSETGIHQMVLLRTGKVLTVLDDGLSSSLFDPSSGTWTPSLDALPVLQERGNLVMLSDGRVLYCGSTNSDGVSVRNGTDLRSDGGFVDPLARNYDDTSMGHIAVLLSGGRVLVAGGINSSSQILSSAETFDPTQGQGGTFTATTSMNIPRLQANALLVANPAPLISQPLVPDAVPVGGSDFPLTVNGSGFVSSSVVHWNGTALTTTFVSFDQLTATVPATDISGAGTSSVTVTNPTPGGGTSNVAFFTVTGPTNSVSLALLPPVGVGITPSDTVVGDFNIGGAQDLAIVNCGDPFPCADGSAGTVSVLVGNGDGTFRSISTQSFGQDPISAAAGDFDRDGKLDLAVADFCPACETGIVSILRGNGDGTLSVGHYPDVSVGANPVAVITADFNGDGNLDLAVANNGSDSVSIRLGNGDGSFCSPPNCPPDVTVGSGPTALVTGDFNGDGILDLAVANAGDGTQLGTLTILLGNGDGTFNAAPGQPPLGHYPVSLVAGDFGSGNLDLAVSNRMDNTVQILLGNGAGTFQTQNVYSVGSLPARITAGDLNGDNLVDLAVVNSGDGTSNGTVAILLGEGNGNFRTSPLPPPTGKLPSSLALGDFNGDGRLDLAVANADDNTVSVLLQTPIVSTNPSSLDFGSQPINTTSASQPVLVTNTGSASLNISGISIAGTNGGDFAEMNDCGTVLSAGASCNVAVTFTPTATGARNATLSISDNAPGSPQTISLTGTGTTLGGPTCAPVVQSTSTLFMISVSANCSPAGGTMIVSTTIDWGDGSPLTLGSSGAHTYATAGTYNVTVSATDNLMRVGAASVPVILPAPPPPAPAGNPTMLMLPVPTGTPANTFSCTSAIGPDGQPISNLDTVGISCAFSNNPNQDQLKFKDRYHGEHYNCGSTSFPHIVIFDIARLLDAISSHCDTGFGPVRRSFKTQCILSLCDLGSVDSVSGYVILVRRRLYAQPTA